MRPIRSVLALFFVLGLAGGVLADDPGAGAAGASAGGEKKEAAPKPPKTVEATKGPFTVTLEMKGTFVPREPVEVTFKPQAWGGDLEVVESTPMGDVKEGDVLVRFKTEKIDEAVQAAEADLAVARKAVEKQAEEGKRQEEATKVALQKQEREHRLADEALDRFRKVEKPLRMAEYEHSLQGTENWITDQKEELAQLEKMYKADDMVEETEEIVLKRTRRNLARAEKSFEFDQQRHKIFLEVELPDLEEGLVLNQRKEANEWDSLQATAGLALEQANLERAKAKLGLKRQEDALAKLKADRDGFVVKAAKAGTAVPSAFVDGKWAGLADMGRGLKPGQKAGAGQVLYTIYEAGPMSIRSSVGEADALRVKDGQRGTAKATAMPDRPMAVQVTHVAKVSDDGNFDVVLDPDKMPEELRPGFGCKIVLDVEKKDAAVTVPDSAVSRDGDKAFVHLWDGTDAKPKEVKVGASCGGRTEIKEGLQGGEKILETAPKKS